MIKERKRTSLLLPADLSARIRSGELQTLIVPLPHTRWEDELKEWERVSPSRIAVYFNDYQLRLELIIGEVVGIKESLLTPQHRIAWYDVARIHIMHRKYLRGKVGMKCGAKSLVDTANLAAAYKNIFKGAYVALITLANPKQ